jgi:YVTN family beta-propeller protein
MKRATIIPEIGQTRIKLWCLLLVLVVTSCAPTNEQYTNTVQQVTARNEGQLSLFLNLKAKESPRTSCEIERVEILTEKGNWEEISRDKITLDAGAIAGGQIFLLRSSLTPGYYSTLRFTLAMAWQQRENGGRKNLIVNDQTVEVPLPKKLYFGPGDSHSVFLTWDVEKSSPTPNTFLPVLLAAPKLINMIADIAYVACPDINTIFMIRTDKNQVFDSLGVSGSPSWLSNSGSSLSDSIYALTPLDASLKKISASANRIVETYNLPMAGTPSHLTLSPNGSHAFVLDRNRGNISRINLLSGQIEQRMRLRDSPSYVLYLPVQDLIAVSLSRSQSVILLNPKTLNPVQTIATSSRPEGLMIWKDRLLYIAESGANSVLVYDLINNKEKKRVLVDLTPRRVMSADGYIFVSNYNSSSISLLSPGQITVSRTIPLTGRPLEFVDVPRNKWIYVGNEDENSLTIIDPVTTRTVGRIELGAKPMGIMVLN